MEYVYPKLRLYCMEKGYELNTVDLHWGIPDEHLNDHSLKELCLGQLTSTCCSLEYLCWRDYEGEVGEAGRKGGMNEY